MLAFRHGQFLFCYSIWLSNQDTKYVKAIKSRRLKSFAIVVVLSVGFDDAKAFPPFSRENIKLII